nr:G protein-coupled receptor [Proales similis]
MSTALDQFVRIAWGYWAPAISLTGVLSNLASAHVLIKLIRSDRTKEVLFYYMLLISSVDFLYSLVQFFCPIFNILSPSYIRHSFANQFYYLLALWITSPLALFNIQLQIVLLAKCYFLMANKSSRFLRVKLLTLVLVLASTSILVYVPKFVAFNITELDSASASNRSGIYTTTASEFSQSVVGQVLLIVSGAVRSYFTWLIMFAFTILTIYRQKSIERRKLKLLSASNRKQSSLVRMTVSISLLYLLTNIPHSIAYALSWTTVSKTIAFNYFYTVSVCVLFIYHSSSFFVFYSFNKIFRKCAKRIYNCRHCRLCLCRLNSNNKKSLK